MANSLFQSTSSLLHHIQKKRRVQFLLIILLSFFGSIIEMLSLGSVIPFIGVIVTPDKIFNLDLIMPLRDFFGFTKPSDLILPLAIIFAALAFLAGFLRLLILYLNLRITFLTGAEISQSVFKKTLHQPYEIHISRNSSNLISVISNKVNIATNILSAWMILLSSSILFLSIVLTIILVEPFIALLAVFIFGGMYFVISLAVKKQLDANGQIVTSAQSEIIKALQEGLGSIRDVLLDSSQKFYEKMYFQSISALNKAYSSNGFILQAPRFILESMAMLLVAALVIYLTTQSQENAVDSFAILALFGLAAQRLLPLMQLIFSSWSSIRSGMPALNDVLELLDQPIASEIDFDDKKISLDLAEEIELKNIFFSFTAKNPWVLRDVNLVIRKGSKVGIIGETGSGKSTLLDLLMGLLLPNQGDIVIDSQALSDKNIKYWQKNVSHVPQSIYLTDTSIKENIAFGIPYESIDDERMINAAKQAQIHDFICTKPNGYNAKVGERGVQLSGGQRQRIGIARALYKETKLIVFDEATSALDNATEKEIMNTIWSLSSDLTIIIVAHRLTTLEKCDCIIELHEGSVKNIGSYKDIV
jgi:ATP-binding cassette, subfamily B, bacterial PglK